MIFINFIFPIAELKEFSSCNLIQQIKKSLALSGTSTEKCHNFHFTGMDAFLIRRYNVCYVAIYEFITSP